MQQIRVQKLKSFFTLLGVMIGVTFLIAVVSIVGGMSRYMTDTLVGKIMAVNSFELRHRPNINLGEHDEGYWRDLWRRPRIRETDVEPVIASLPDGVRWAVLGNDNLVVESKYVAKPQQVQTYTVTEDYFAIKRMEPAQGRLFSPQEYERGMPVIVIGEDVAKYFFPALDPVNRQVTSCFRRRAAKGSRRRWSRYARSCARGTGCGRIRRTTSRSRRRILRSSSGTRSRAIS